MTECGGDAGGPLRRARPRAVVVGARAAGARADEARPPAAPLPGQVRPAARRGAARALRAARRPRARPVRRLGDDARAGARVRLRRRRRRHRRVQRAADRGQDARARPRDARGRRSATSAGRLGASDERPTGFVRDWFAPQAAAELLHFRSLVPEYASQDVLRVVLARAARSARLTTHFDLDFPRAPQQGEYWCHKHRRTCRPVESAGKFLTPLPRRHGRPDRGVRGGARPTSRRRRPPRRRARARARRPVRRRDHVAALPGPDRLPRAAPLRLRAARRSTTGASASSAPPRAGRARRRSRSTSPGSRPCLRASKAALRRGAPVCIVVNDRRELYPEILERAGLRLDERLERHVNRRTGRRAGEYFESILICR